MAGQVRRIGWFLRDIDGVRTVGHDGSANGQFANLLTVPERGFAVAVLSNAGPDGGMAGQPGRRRVGAGALPGRRRPGP
jgi:hypothetical protein